MPYLTDEEYKDLEAELQHARDNHLDAEKYKNRYAARIVDLEGVIRTLTAEVNELREALKESLSLLDHTEKYGTFPQPHTPWTPNAIKRLVNHIRVILVKYPRKDTPS